MSKELLIPKASHVIVAKPKWNVNYHIDKYNDWDHFMCKRLDDVFEGTGNNLTNAGVNHLWSLVAGTAGSVNAFGVGAYIGVGDNKKSISNPTDPGTRLPEATDEELYAEVNKLYMKMDDGYPIAGQNQKIIFRSTFKPGTACFEWREWTVANGNGNPSSMTGPLADQNVIRTEIIGTDPLPDPIPKEESEDSTGYAYQFGRGETQISGDEANTGIVMLNHKVEAMGEKYSAATWVVSIEISLS